MSFDRRRKSSPRVALRGSGFRQRIVADILVLLVEDDEMVARAIGRQLGSLGADVVTVGTVADGRQRLHDPAMAFSAVLADICLLGNVHGGAEVLEYALLVKPGVCAMAMTALERTRDLDDRIARLQIPLVRKPLEASVLAAFVRRASSIRRSSHARRIAIVELLGDAARLTETECRALFHLSHGSIPLEIGQAMGIDESTARGHLHEIRRKFGVHSVNAVYGRIIEEIFGAP